MTAQGWSRRRSRRLQSLFVAAGAVLYAAMGGLAGGGLTYVVAGRSRGPELWRTGSRWGAGAGGVLGAGYGWVLGTLVAIRLEHDPGTAEEGGPPG